MGGSHGTLCNLLFIGWSEAKDLLEDCLDKDGFRCIMRRAYPRKSRIVRRKRIKNWEYWVKYAADKVWLFIGEMNVHDVVLVRRRADPVSSSMKHSYCLRRTPPICSSLTRR